MKSLLWLLAVGAAAVALVLLARVDSGYVLFIYPPWRVEMSMVLFVVGALIAFFLLYALFRLVGSALVLPVTVRAWRARRRRERAQAALAAALQAYYEGRYARAEKEAAIAFENGPTPGVAALLAARAAHQMRDFDRRDRWLERADASGDALQAARLVSRAELALEDRDFNAAREALRNLHGAGPKHVATTRLLLRAERGAGAWDEVLRLASQLSKRDAISPALAEEYKVQATVELLARSADEAGAFERRWRGIAAADFFKGMFETALAPDEIIASVEFPVAQRSAYAKFPNPASRFALVGVFVAQAANGDVRVAVTGAAPSVFRAKAIEDALRQSFTPATAKGVKMSAEGLNRDLHGSPEYRAHLIPVMASRAVAMIA